MKSVCAARRRLVGATTLGLTLLAAGCAAIPGMSDAVTLLQEGEQLLKDKRYDEAIAKFRAAIVQDPLNWRAWLGLARAFIAKLNWGEAIASGRRAFELSPQGPEVVQTFLQALFGGGVQALNNGNFSESIRHFGEYLKLDGSNPGAWINAGKAYLGNKQYADALKSLMQALGLSNANRSEVIGALLAGGTQAFKERDYGSAANLLREYVKQDPRNLQAYLTLAKSYWESGQRSGALEAFTQALRINPTNSEALQYLLKLK